MEVLREPPEASSFVPLIEHQSTTPASFYSGPPVLHYYSDRSKVRILQREIDNAPAFAPLFQNAQSVEQRAANGEAQSNGDSDPQKVVDEVDIWVTSEYALRSDATVVWLTLLCSKLFLYSSTAAAGVAIPYRSISLHAIQTLPAPSPESSEQGVYMQLLASTEEPSSEDLEPDSLSVTMIPTASAPPAPTTTEPDPELATEDKPEQTPVQALFNALSECANLHPDPIEDGEEDDEGVSRLIRSGLAMPGDSSGGLPPPMPGSGGWITAENMHEFVDEDGNWIQDEDERAETEEGQGLGPGAGTVRGRDDDEVEGNGDVEDETKWQRIS